MINFGINQVGVYKYQQGTSRGGLLPRKYSGTWGNRGQGNELQSALEILLSQTGDMIINSEDYIGQGLAYLGGLLPGGLSAEEAVQNERNKQTAKKEGKKGFVNAFGKYEYFPIYGVAPDVTIAKMPGWQLKGLMQGSQLEKQLSKAGTININGLQAYLNKTSKLEQDVIGKVLSNKFAGQKNIDYNALRKAVQDELITYSRKPQNQYSTYGMDKLGFDKKQELDGVGDVVDYVPGVKTQTFTFESPRIPRGDGRHYDETTLGHSRTYTTSDEPEVLHVMESQSDWAQNKNAHNLRDYLPEEQQGVDWAIKRMLEPYRQKFIDKYPQYTKQYDDHITYARQGIYDTVNDEGFLEALKQIIPIDHYTEVLNRYARIKSGKNLSQRNYLQQNYLSRQLQENMIFAAEQDQKKMRYPTSDTAAKIEGYKKEHRIEFTPEQEAELERLDDLAGEIMGQFYQDYPDAINYSDSKLIEELNKYPGYKEANDALNTLRNSRYDYFDEYKTILKKYADFPKMFNKLFKGQEVRTVTDPKGNTWYEVDIPENFLQSEWQFQKGGILGLNKIIGL